MAALEVREMVQRILSVSEILLTVATEEEIDRLLSNSNQPTSPKANSKKQKKNSKGDEK